MIDEKTIWNLAKQPPNLYGNVTLDSDTLYAMGRDRDALLAQVTRLQRAYRECEAWANPPGDGVSHRYEYHGLHPGDLDPPKGEDA